MPLTSAPGTDSANPGQDATQPIHARLPQQAKGVGSFSYILYLLYTFSYFIHLTARLKFLGAIHFDQITAALIILTLLMQQNALKGRLANRPSRVILVLLAYIAITLPFVEWPGSVLRGNFEVFLKSFVFFPFTVLIIDTDKRLKTFVFLFVACQVFRVLEPLYLHITTGYWGSATYMGNSEFAARLSGAPSDIVNPNGLAFVIVSAIPFLHYLLAERGMLYKSIYASILAALLYALTLTLSRGGLIALFIVFAAFLLQSRHKLVFAALAVVAAIGIWAHMSPTQHQRYLSLTDTNDPFHATVSGRVRGLTRDLHMALQRPIVGHGLGTSKEATYHSVGQAQITHNMYLEAFVELGIGGLAIFLLFFRSIFIELRTTAHILKSSLGTPANGRSARSYELKLNLALHALFWMYLVFSLNYFGVSDYYWYLLGGMAVVLSRLTHAKAHAPQPSIRINRLGTTKADPQTIYSQMRNRL